MTIDHTGADVRDGGVAGFGLIPVLLVVVSFLVAGCGTTPEQQEDQVEFQIQMNKGRAYLERGRPQMALRALTLARKMRPDNVEMLSMLGVVYDHLERPAQSLAVLAKAHRLRPDDSEIHHNYGVALLRLKRYDEAEKSFREVLSNPEFLTPEDAHFNLAILYQQQEKYREMEMALEQTITLRPDHITALITLADHNRLFRRFNKEQHYLRLATDQRPGDGVLMDRLADAYKRNGKLQQAREVWQRMVERAPTSPEGQRAAMELKRWSR
ncbi:MAG: tetratricopeptide repeat protein [Magnetococcales bacterium]|nr:tetratricopeptide repeat protein [Magnetococcales bacterium]